MDYKHYIKWNRIISTSAIISTTAGVVAGGITLNPLILGVISGIGLLLSGVKELLKYEKKSEKAYFAYCEFNKVLCALRNAKRTSVFDILVPRPYDPSGLRQESRALGATISGMRHRCRLRETGWAEIGYFLCYFKMVAPRALDSCRRPEGS